MTLIVGAPISLSRVTSQLTPIEEHTGVLIEGANHRDIIYHSQSAVGRPRSAATHRPAATVPALRHDSTRTPEHAFAVRRSILVDLSYIGTTAVLLIYSHSKFRRDSAHATRRVDPDYTYTDTVRSGPLQYGPSSIIRPYRPIPM